MKLSGRNIAEKLYGELQERVEKLKEKHITPHLVVILVGEHPASLAYVILKQKKGEEIGAKITVLHYEPTVTTEELTEKIKLLNIDPFVHGILIQRPLPMQIDIEKLELVTDPRKDIDGFHPDAPYTLPLPLAVMKILEEVHHVILANEVRPESKKDAGQASMTFQKWLQKQKIVLLGKGPAGGGPISTYFKKLHLNPHLIDSKTKEPEKLTQQADIIISAVGKRNTIKQNMIKKGVILIGVGITQGEDKKLHGDYEPDVVKDNAAFYTTTPGGVGPVNVAMLMENLITATERQTNKI